MLKLPFVLALVLALSLIPSQARGADVEELGVALLDVTKSSGCKTSTGVYNPANPSEVRETPETSCLQGSVIRSVSATREEARDMGALFLKSSGDPILDAEQFHLVRIGLAQMGAMGGSGKEHSFLGRGKGVASLACTPNSFYKNLNYYVYNQGTVYGTVWYNRATDCSYKVTQGRAFITTAGNIWWRQAEYGALGWWHDCQKLSRSYLYDYYSRSSWVSPGNWYVDESIDAGGEYGCAQGGGNSYTGSAYIG